LLWGNVTLLTGIEGKTIVTEDAKGRQASRDSGFPVPGAGGCKCLKKKLKGGMEKNPAECGTRIDDAKKGERPLN